MGLSVLAAWRCLIQSGGELKGTSYGWGFRKKMHGCLWMLNLLSAVGVPGIDHGMGATGVAVGDAPGDACSSLRTKSDSRWTEPGSCGHVYLAVPLCVRVCILCRRQHVEAGTM